MISIGALFAASDPLFEAWAGTETEPGLNDSTNSTPLASLLVSYPVFFPDIRGAECRAKPLVSMNVQQVNVVDGSRRGTNHNPREEVSMTRRSALYVSVAVGVMSQSSIAGPLAGGPEIFQLCQEELRLSDEQLAEIKELHFAMRLDEIEKRASVETAELELARGMDAADPEEERIMQLFEDVYKARMDLERIHVRHRLRMKSILTETQELELKRLLHEQRAQRKGPPPHGRPRR